MTEFKPAQKRRFRAPGGESSLGFFILTLLLSTILHAKEVLPEAQSKPAATEKSEQFLKINRQIYIPKKRDFGLELGTLWEEQTFLWLGGHIGFSIGTCPGFEEQNCQSYLDILGGLGARKDDSTQRLSLSWRWQFVNYPSAWSPFARVQGGFSNSQVGGVKRKKPIVGFGVGIATRLNKKLDVHFELRVGHTHQLFSQANLGVKLPVDEWVSSFAQAVEKLGKKTINATGDLIRSKTSDSLKSKK